MNAGAGNSLSERVGRVAAIAGKFSDSVDKEGRFPREAIDAMKAEGLLGIQVPCELGGERGNRPDCGTVLHSRPVLRIERDDLRHASHQAFKPGGARPDG